MSVVTVETTDGKVLGIINDENKTVEMTERWKKLQRKRRSKKTDTEKESQLDG